MWGQERLVALTCNLPLSVKDMNCGGVIRKSQPCISHQITPILQLNENALAMMHLKHPSFFYRDDSEQSFTKNPYIFPRVINIRTMCSFGCTADRQTNSICSITLHSGAGGKSHRKGCNVHVHKLPMVNSGICMGRLKQISHKSCSRITL